MHMRRGGGPLVNRLDPSDQQVPGSVEHVTRRARRPLPGLERSRLRRLRRPLRTATVMMVGVAGRSPAGLRRPAIRWAAVSPVQAPPRWGQWSTPDRRRPGCTPGRPGLERGREAQLSGRTGCPPSPRFPSSESPRRTPFRPGLRAPRAIPWARPSRATGWPPSPCYPGSESPAVPPSRVPSGASRHRAGLLSRQWDRAVFFLFEPFVKRAINGDL